MSDDKHLAATRPLPHATAATPAPAHATMRLVRGPEAAPAAPRLSSEVSAFVAQQSRPPEITTTSAAGLVLKLSLSNSIDAADVSRTLAHLRRASPELSRSHPDVVAERETNAAIANFEKHLSPANDLTSMARRSDASGAFARLQHRVTSVLDRPNLGSAEKQRIRDTMKRMEELVEQIRFGRPADRGALQKELGKLTKAVAEYFAEQPAQRTRQSLDAGVAQVARLAGATPVDTPSTQSALRQLSDALTAFRGVHGTGTAPSLTSAIANLEQLMHLQPSSKADQQTHAALKQLATEQLDAALESTLDSLRDTVMLRPVLGGSPTPRNLSLPERTELLKTLGQLSVRIRGAYGETAMPESTAEHLERLDFFRTDLREEQLSPLVEGIVDQHYSGESAENVGNPALKRLFGSLDVALNNPESLNAQDLSMMLNILEHKRAMVQRRAKQGFLSRQSTENTIKGKIDKRIAAYMSLLQTLLVARRVDAFLEAHPAGSHGDPVKLRQMFKDLSALLHNHGEHMSAQQLTTLGDFQRQEVAAAAATLRSEGLARIVGDRRKILGEVVELQKSVEAQAKAASSTKRTQAFLDAHPPGSHATHASFKNMLRDLHQLLRTNAEHLSTEELQEIYGLLNAELRPIIQRKAGRTRVPPDADLVRDGTRYVPSRSEGETGSLAVDASTLGNALRALQVNPHAMETDDLAERVRLLTAVPDYSYDW